MEVVDDIPEMAIHTADVKTDRDNTATKKHNTTIKGNCVMLLISPAISLGKICHRNSLTEQAVNRTPADLTDFIALQYVARL
jgi:hypothetical protein